MNPNPSFPTVLPQLVGATGGVEPACRALRETDFSNEFAQDCCYCLDAPNLMPAGGTRDHIAGTREYPMRWTAPVCYCRDC